MRKALASALVALSLVGGIATAANADVYPYGGDRTTSQQEPSPN